MEVGPLVSVLMTAYNREKYIGEAISSVLASTYVNFELIVVDDCSRDRTVEIARSFEIKDSRVKVYVNEKNLGDYPNRNRAAEYARGKYIKYLDADDLIYYYGLDIMVTCMERFPEAGFGLASIVTTKPLPLCISPTEIYREHFSVYGHFNRAPGSSIILLSEFKKMGGFSGIRMVGDFEFWFRIARTASMVKFPFDLYWCREHDEQESKTDFARRKYSELQREIIFKSLTHPDCPLKKEETEKIIKGMKRSLLRSKYFGWIRGIEKVLGIQIRLAKK